MEQVRRTAGSYDFPPQKVITIEKALEKNQKANKAIDSIEKNDMVIVPQAFDWGKEKQRLTACEKKEVADTFEVRRNQFKEDLKTLTEGVESQEERIAIINALAGLYGRNNKTVPYDPTDPWDIP